MTIRPSLSVCATLFLAILFATPAALRSAAETAAPPPAATQTAPAVLCLGNSAPQMAAFLALNHNLQLGRAEFNQLTWETLKPFNAVIVFDMSRVNPETKSVDAVEISPAGLQRVGDLLERFVREGGGLYVYGVSYTHMGQGWAADTLNQFLKRFDAQVLFEELRDLPREQRQPGERQVLYALADRIATHPATADVKALWYAVGPFSYGPWTRPLSLGPEWTPLIRTSESFTATPLGNPMEAARPIPGATTGVKEKSAVIYAVREVGKGRIVLSGGESTMSFFGYRFSDYADRQWGRIGMEAGLNGTPSDGLKLFVASLRWLAEPSVAAGTFGGYVLPPAKPFAPRVIQPVTWADPKPSGGGRRYAKGVIGALPALGGGSGTVAQFAETANALGLDFLVVTGDFEKMEKPAWDQLVAECQATTGNCAIVPALITRDDQDNRFLQCGRTAWPKPDRLSKTNPKRVQDHLGYWMNDCNFPFRAAFRLSEGQYPAWLHSGYDTFAVRTYMDGKLVDEQVEGFRQNQEQGDRSRLVVVTLTRAPEKLSQTPEFTYIAASGREQIQDHFTRSQFSGGSLSFVSTGPQVPNWTIANASRDTAGERYTPGTERWRLTLRATSAVPLKSVTIYDSTRIFRRYAVQGNECEIQVDGLHDTRRVLTAVVEDVTGGRAMTGAVETGDRLLAQYFCSDRCNIMGGVSTIRTADGHELGIPATTMIYKAGRLSVSTVGQGEELPGIDGAGMGVNFSLAANLYLVAADPARSEERAQIHRIGRPYENADCIIFDTPILKRSTTPEHEIYGHAPYVNLVDPLVDTRLVQYHFYRSPMYPSPALADFSLTAREAVQLKAGWQGFQVRFAAAWGNPKKYTIVRRDGTLESGPSADEKQGTAWRGTLKPGDSFYLPEWGEGFYAVAGDLGVAVECVPTKKWFRLWTGRSDLTQLAAGETVQSRILIAKMPRNEEPGLRAWQEFARQYGLTGEPAYTPEVTQGKLLSTRYALELQADGAGAAVRIPQANLPQRLPIIVRGLNPNWTVARVDLQRRQWFPLGVWNGATYTTVAPADGNQDLFIGNLLTCGNPELFLTLLPANADGKVYADVHNPTDNEITTEVTVPVASFLAAAQRVPVVVAPGSSLRVELKP